MQLHLLNSELLGIRVMLMRLGGHPNPANDGHLKTGQ